MHNHQSAYSKKLDYDISVVFCTYSKAFVSDSECSDKEEETNNKVCKFLTILSFMDYPM